MHIFFAPGLTGKQFPLNEEESLHLSKVLRLKLGETVRLLDGAGGMFEGEIQLVHQKNSVIGNLRKVEDNLKRPYRLHVAASPIKMTERFEWFLEKATEIGIDEITPVICSRTERSVIKLVRMEKIVQAAMKQSMNALHPKINECISFEQFLKTVSATSNGFIAHCMEGKKPLLVSAVNHVKDATVLVGPEGDFTPQEVQKAEAAGFTSVSLGESRLRAETAAVIVCAQIQASWQLDPGQGGI